MKLLEALLTMIENKKVCSRNIGEHTYLRIVDGQLCNQDKEIVKYDINFLLTCDYELYEEPLKFEEGKEYRLANGCKAVLAKVNNVLDAGIMLGFVLEDGKWDAHKWCTSTGESMEDAYNIVSEWTNISKENAKPNWLEAQNIDGMAWSVPRYDKMQVHIVNGEAKLIKSV